MIVLAGGENQSAARLGEFWLRSRIVPRPRAPGTGPGCTRHRPAPGAGAAAGARAPRVAVHAVRYGVSKIE